MDGYMDINGIYIYILWNYININGWIYGILMEYIYIMELY